MLEDEAIINNDERQKLLKVEPILYKAFFDHIRFRLPYRICSEEESKMEYE
jgi:hypothetical protein